MGGLISRFVPTRLLFSAPSLFFPRLRQDGTESPLVYLSWPPLRAECTSHLSRSCGSRSCSAPALRQRASTSAPACAATASHASRCRRTRARCCYERRPSARPRAQSPEPRAQSPKPSPAQLSQAHGRLCQPRSEAADLVRLTRFQLGSCGRRRSARRGSRSRTRRSWRRRASSRRIRGGTLATVATPAAASCSSSGATTAARPVEGGLTPAAQLGSPAAWQRSAGPASWQRRSSVAPWQPRPPRAELPGSGPLRSSGSKPCRHRPRTPRLEPPPSLTPQASPHRRREAQPHRRATCYLVITPYQVV